MPGCAQTHIWWVWHINWNCILCILHFGKWCFYFIKSTSFYKMTINQSIINHSHECFCFVLLLFFFHARVFEFAVKQYSSAQIYQKTKTGKSHSKFIDIGTGRSYFLLLPTNKYITYNMSLCIQIKTHREFIFHLRPS